MEGSVFEESLTSGICESSSTEPAMALAGVQAHLDLAGEVRIRWLDARMAALYFQTLAGYYRLADHTATAIGALAGSAALAEGLTRTPFLPAWQALTVLSVVSITIRPILLSSKRMADLSQASGQWTQRALEWDRLRLRIQQGKKVNLHEIEAAMERDAKLDEALNHLPNWRWLIKRCQRRIKKADGLPIHDQTRS